MWEQDHCCVMGTGWRLGCLAYVDVSSVSAASLPSSVPGAWMAWRFCLCL